MFCGNCGTKIADGATACPSCGWSEMSRDSGKMNYSGGNSNEKNGAFIDASEQQIAVLGQGYLDSVIRGNGLSKGTGVVTDKRYYFKGRCFSKKGGFFAKNDEEWIVDLQDVTATGFTYRTKLVFIVLAIISVIVGFCFAAEEDAAGIFAIGVVLAIVFLFIYYLTKQTMYVVHFEGGAIGLNVAKYGGTKTVKEFDRKLRKAKDMVIKNM